MITEDEAMIAELRQTNKSRSSLRSKHLAQLEENKADLNEIKQQAAQKLISNSSVDQDLPVNEDQGDLLSFYKYNLSTFSFWSPNEFPFTR